MAIVLEDRPTKDGRRYYYLNWFARVDGKTKRIKQIYIGTLKKLAEKLTDPLKNVKLKSYSFGHFALFLNICDKLKLKDIFLTCVCKKHADITYKSLFLIILNRLDKPTSKNKINNWYKKCIMRLFIKLKNVSSQSLWNQMNYLNENEISLIKELLVENIEKYFSPHDDKFNYDQTNFFTYCQQYNSKLLKKGRNKKKRHDKNQIGVSLLIGQDSEIPYFYNTFPGNMHDSKEFLGSLKSIKEVLSFVKSPEITIMIDKGNKSRNIFDELYEAEEYLFDPILFKKYHFVSSLCYTEVKDLLLIPLCEYKKIKLDNGKEVEVISTEKMLYGIKTKVVTSFNEKLFNKQNKTYQKNIAKAERVLNSLQSKRYQTEKNIFTELSSKIKSSIYGYINVESKKIKGGFTFNWKWKRNKLNTLEDKLGKTIVFSSHFDWDEKQIITAYRTSYKVEKGFKYLNNHFIVPLDPIYHWTDQKIKVHVFCCFIALVIVKLIEFEARLLGVYMEYIELLEELKDIRVCAVSKNKKVSFMYETLSPMQVDFIHQFGLNTQFKF